MVVSSDQFCRCQRDYSDRRPTHVHNIIVCAHENSDIADIHRHIYDIHSDDNVVIRTPDVSGPVHGEHPQILGRIKVREGLRRENPCSLLINKLARD